MEPVQHPLWMILEHQGREIKWLARRARVSEDLCWAVKAGRRRATEDFRRRCAEALDLPESVLFLGGDHARAPEGMAAATG